MPRARRGLGMCAWVGKFSKNRTRIGTMDRSFHGGSRSVATADEAYEVSVLTIANLRQPGLSRNWEGFVSHPNTSAPFKPIRIDPDGRPDTLFQTELPLGDCRGLRFESNYVAFVHVCMLFAPHGAGLGTLRIHTPSSSPYTTFENTSVQVDRELSGTGHDIGSA